MAKKYIENGRRFCFLSGHTLKKGSKFDLARIYETTKDIERVNNTNETNLVLTKFRIKSANGKERVSVSTLCT